MQSLLITGGNSKQRRLEAERIAEAQSSRFDTIYIETQIEKGIEAARKLVAALSRKPFESQATTAIVVEAQNLTSEAQNSLLKVLEEPSESAQIILTAPSSNTLLPTIVSRCLETRLNVETEEITNQEEDLEDLDKLIIKWGNLIKESSTNENKSGFKLAEIHRYTKTLLRLKKAEKLFANKKLLALVATLENPQAKN